MFNNTIMFKEATINRTIRIISYKKKSIKLYDKIYF